MRDWLLAEQISGDERNCERLSHGEPVVAGDVRDEG